LKKDNFFETENQEDFNLEVLFNSKIAMMTIWIKFKCS